MTTTVAPAVQTPESKASTTDPGVMTRIRRFLREVLVELKKTNWPSRDELTKYTIVVMITIVLVAVYLYASDFIAFNFTKLVGISPK